MSAQNEMNLIMTEVVATAVAVVPDELLPVTIAELLEADFHNDDEAEFLQAVLSLQQEIEDVLLGDDPETFLIPDETNLPPAIQFIEKLEELKSFAFGERTMARMERRIRGENEVVRPKMTETDKANNPAYRKCPDCLRHFTKRYLGFHMGTDICVKVKTAHNLRPSASDKRKVSPKIYNACYDLENLYARAVDYRKNIEPELEEEVIEEQDPCVYVVKTWVYNHKEDVNDYAGLWEDENGKKEFTYEEAKVQFEYAIETQHHFSGVSLVKIDPNSEDRETCLEDWDGECEEEEEEEN